MVCLALLTLPLHYAVLPILSSSLPLSFPILCTFYSPLYSVFHSIYLFALKEFALLKSSTKQVSEASSVLCRGV